MNHRERISERETTTVMSNFRSKLRNVFWPGGTAGGSDGHNAPGAGGRKVGGAVGGGGTDLEGLNNEDDTEMQEDSGPHQSGNNLYSLRGFLLLAIMLAIGIAVGSSSSSSSSLTSLRSIFGKSIDESIHDATAKAGQSGPKIPKGNDFIEAPEPVFDSLTHEEGRDLLTKLVVPEACSVYIDKRLVRLCANYFKHGCINKPKGPISPECKPFDGPWSEDAEREWHVRACFRVYKQSRRAFVQCTMSMAEMDAPPPSRETIDTCVDEHEHFPRPAHRFEECIIDEQQSVTQSTTSPTDSTTTMMSTTSPDETTTTVTTTTPTATDAGCFADECYTHNGRMVAAFTDTNRTKFDFPDQICDVRELVVAGGGGGGGGNQWNYGGAGGGAGEVISSVDDLSAAGRTLLAGTYAIVVGVGGSGGAPDEQGSSGTDSSFDGMVAKGGGCGGLIGVSGCSGGSGGGGSIAGSIPGEAEPNAGLGSDGGKGATAGGGGGGAGGVGGSILVYDVGGAGGVGMNYTADIGSDFGALGGGGGGGSRADSAGIASHGGGAGGKGGDPGEPGNSATANTGGGGGGGGGGTGLTIGGDGGSGLILLTYAACSD